MSLQRTLRIPDDGRDYPLPPGLGRFPLRHLDDYAKRVPASWTKRGGLIMPMWQAEAMWLSFGGFDYPFALKVATGKINAVTRAAWCEPLKNKPQDYLALPSQPWLDGYCVEKGIIRQFVAAPMGKGITVEEQLTGEAEWGGLQLLAYPMKAARYAELQAKKEAEWGVALFSTLHEERACLSQSPMGLAAGGRMRQHIHEDAFDIADWDQDVGARCFITIVNFTEWAAVTGEPMPTRPVDAAAYAEAGLPWFSHYSDAPALEGSPKLQTVRSIADLWPPQDQEAFDFAAPVDVGRVVQIGNRPIREMASE